MKKKKTGGKKHTVHLHAPIPCEPARSKMEAHGLTHTACAQTPGRAQDETGQSVDPQNAGVPLSDGTSPRTVRNSVFLYTSRVSRGGCGATWSAHRKRRDVDRAFLSIVVSKSVGAFLHFLSSVRCSPQRVRTWALEKAKNRGERNTPFTFMRPSPVNRRAPKWRRTVSPIPLALRRPAVLKTKRGKAWTHKTQAFH